MTLFRHIFIFITLSLSSFAHSLELTDINYYQKYFQRYAHVGSEIISPSKDWNEVINLSLVLGTTFLLDRTINDWLQDNQTDTFDDLASFTKVIGSPKDIYPVMAGTYLYSIFNDDFLLRKVTLQAYGASTIASLITAILDSTIDRERPNGDYRLVSFPSGHTTFAFSIATVVAESYKDSPYIYWGSYGLAWANVWSRLYNEAHWASDALMGAIIGHFVAKSVMGYNIEETPGALSLSPSLNESGFGIRAIHTF